MTKIRKVKRRQKYKVNVNRKRLRNKLRKQPTIQCDPIKNAWENSKSVRRNLTQMGLAYDANQLFKVPSNKSQIIKSAKSLDSTEDLKTINSKNKVVKNKISVAMELEVEARAPRERKFRLPQNQVNFLTYLMEKHGEDYEAMARDKKNYYQLTGKQIRRQVNVLKNIPEQYAEFLVKNGEIVLDDPEPLEVTKKKIREENVKKFNLPQPGSKRQEKKMKKTRGWVVEDVRKEEEDKVDCLDDQDDDNVDVLEELDQNDNGRDKLQLFSDDDDDEDDDDDSAGELEDDQEGDFVSLSDMSGEEMSEDDATDFSSDSE